MIDLNTIVNILLIVIALVGGYVIGKLFDPQPRQQTVVKYVEVVPVEQVRERKIKEVSVVRHPSAEDIEHRNKPKRLRETEEAMDKLLTETLGPL